MSARHVVALVGDLMDRSRIDSATSHPVTFVRRPDDLSAVADVDVLVVDLHLVDDPRALRDALPNARIVAFAAHVDDDRLAAARSAGLDVVLPRSRFFRSLDELLE